MWIIAILVLFFGAVVFFGAPYVPSRRRYIERAFQELYLIKETDVLVDLGSGDGVVLRTAVRCGAKKAVGYELNPLLVVISRLLCKNGNIKVFTRDFWQVKFPDDTTIIYGFSVSRDGRRMIKKLQSEADRLGRPIHYISHAIELPSVASVGRFEAYVLYEFSPLQHNKAQV